MDIVELKRLAMAATPGTWEWWTSNSVKRITAMQGTDGGVLSAYVRGNYADVRISDQDAEYITAANPSVVIKLIDRIEALEREVKQQRSLNKDYVFLINQMKERVACAMSGETIRFTWMNHVDFDPEIRDWPQVLAFSRDLLSRILADSSTAVRPQPASKDSEGQDVAGAKGLGLAAPTGEQG